MKIEYAATIKKDGKHHLVTFPDFPEAHTDGETLGEALHNAAEALTVTLEGRMVEDIEIPAPGARVAKVQHRVAPAARVQSALGLKFSRGNHTVAEVARALGTSWTAVSRLEDPHHSPSLRQLEKAAAAVGKRLMVIFENEDEPRRT